MNKISWDQFEHFSEKEFACPCCGLCNISPHFICQLAEARDIAGIPFKITSGCRCKVHNKEVGGKEKSAHLCSQYIPSTACDIYVNTDRKRFIIVRALIDSGFTHIGIGKDFIHVDDDRRSAMWLY